MRLIIVSGIFPPDIGGPATHADDLRHELEARGHSAWVITLWDGAVVDSRDGLVRFPRRWPWPVRFARVAAWIAANRRRFDAVYATGMHPEAVTGARLGGLPVVVKVVGDPVWERGRREGLTGADFEGFQRYGGSGLRLAAMRLIRNASLRAASAVITPSAYLAGVVDGWLGGPSNATVIPNGVREPAVLETRTGDGSLVVAYVGRLVRHKRVERLIRAAAEVDGIRIEVVGSGPEQAGLEAEAGNLGLGERVVFMGSLPHDQVMRRLAAADVLALASDYEGLPHVVIEALVAGTPVLSPPVGGVPEVVQDGVSGLIVPEATEAELSAALERMRDDDGLRDALAAGARETGSRWRIEATADGVLALLTRVAAPRPLLVIVGRARIPGGADPEFRAKLERMLPHADLLQIGTGRMGARGLGRSLTVAFPSLRPKALGSALFYGLAPILSVAIAALRDRAAVMCQSPYEAAGVLVLARMLPDRMRPRVIVDVHGDWRTATRLYGSPFRRFVAPLADRVAARTVRRADRVRVTGDYTEQLVREVGYRGEVDRFVAFSDFDVFLERPRAAACHEPLVAFLGGFQAAKGLDTVLEAWPRVLSEEPRARLEVAGPGRMNDDVLAFVRNLGPSVCLRGMLSGDEVVALLDRAAMLVMPSRSEGLGRAALEAHARGRPVVAAAVGGLPEVVTDGKTGLLVPPEDARALADGIVRLLRDPALSAALGAEGRTRIEQRSPSEEFGRGIARLASWVAG